MTFSPRQLESAARHLHAAAQLVLDAIAEPPLSDMGKQLRRALVITELQKAARALGYRLEKNGGRNGDEDEGGD